MKINEYVKHIRTKLEMTQDEFARQLGLQRSTVANYETGNTKPSVDVWIRIQTLEKIYEMQKRTDCDNETAQAS